MTTIATAIRKVFTTAVKAVEGKDRTLEFVGSTESKDRDGEVIKASAWMVDKYVANPVVQWAHDYTSPPIGKTLSIRQENGNTVFEIEFAPAETYEFADTIYKLCKGGFLSATSVGFIPVESTAGKKETDPRRTFTKVELLEISIVPVPSNPDALVTARDAGVITVKEFKAFKKTLGDDIAGAEVEDRTDRKKIVNFTDELTDNNLHSDLWGMLDTLSSCIWRTMRDKQDANKAATIKAHGEAFNNQFNSWVIEAEKSGFFNKPVGNDDMFMLTHRPPVTKGHQPNTTSQESIKDEIDYLDTMIKAVGLSPENTAALKRIAGSDMPVTDKAPASTIREMVASVIKAIDGHHDAHMKAYKSIKDGLCAIGDMPDEMGEESDVTDGKSLAEIKEETKRQILEVLQNA